MIRRCAALLVLVLLTACASQGGDADAPAAAWRWRPPPLGSVGMPGADSTGVAFTYGHLRLVLLDASGRARWETERLGLRDVAPLVLAHRIVAGTDNGVAAFDRETGKIIWDVDLGDRGNAPVLAGNRIAVTTWDGRVVVLDADSGASVSTVTLPGDVLGPPAATASTVVATWDTGIEAGVVALDAMTGAVRWQHAVGADGVSSPAIVGSVAVVVTGDLETVAFDLATGARRWTRATPGAGSPEVPPVRDERDVIVADRLGTLLRLRASDGSVVWRTSGRGAAVRGGPAVGRNWAALPVDDGRALVRADRVRVLDPAGRVSGVAAGPDEMLLVATREAQQNELIAYRL